MPLSDVLLDAIRRFAAQATSYPPQPGNAVARTMTASFLAAQWQRPVDSANVMIAAGATAAMAASLLATTKAGDAVLVPKPCYPNVRRAVVALGRVAIDYDGTSDDALADPAAVLRPDVRAILIVNPHNPGGWVSPPRILDALAQAAAAAGVALIMDAAFQDFCWASGPPAPLPLLPGMVTLGSFGKALGDPNVRAGWVHTLPALSQTIAQQHWALTMSCSNVFAGLSALAIDATSRVADVRAEGLQRMTSAIAGAAAAGFSLEMPTAGLCFWIDLGEGDMDAFTATLQQEHNLIVRPSSFFGAPNSSFIRAALAENASATFEGFRRLAEAINAR